MSVKLCRELALIRRGGPPDVILKNRYYFGLLPIFEFKYGYFRSYIKSNLPQMP